MSTRYYYSCEKCGFSYVDVSLFFCFRQDTGFVEKYESLFSTMDYADGSPVSGRVIQHYCKNCDKIVSVYVTGPYSSIFDKDTTIDFLRQFIPKKQETFLKNTVLLNKLSEMIEDNAMLIDINAFIEEHKDDLRYKMDIEDYLDEKSFESMDFCIKDYVKEEAIERFNEEIFTRSRLFELSNKDLERIHSLDLDRLRSSDLNLKSLYKDLNDHYNGLKASDLNKKDLYIDLGRKFDELGHILKAMEREIICINYLGDDSIYTLDGREIEDGICPDCGEELYEINGESPCPKCGNEEMDFKMVHYD